ncbi:MAG: hypothetical protein V1678_03665 [Candidatus Aenigmatarchaeota archaeon]
MKKKILCPKCGSENMTYNPWLGQIWSCQHCNYRGPVDFVEGGFTKEDEKILREISEEIKNEKFRPKKDDKSRKYAVMALALVIAVMMVPLIFVVAAGIILFAYSIWNDFLKK